MSTLRKTLAVGVLSLSLLHASAANALTTYFMQWQGQGYIPLEHNFFQCGLMEVFRPELTYHIFYLMTLSCNHIDYFYFHPAYFSWPIQEHRANHLAWLDFIPYSCPNGVFGDSTARVYWKITGGAVSSGYMQSQTIYDCPGGPGN